MEKKVAYLVNQYPKVSHTFIRREIAAVERQGVEVVRIAIRGWSELLPDPEDERERDRTFYVLRRGLKGLFLALLWCIWASPLRLIVASCLAIKLWSRSDRRFFWNHGAYLLEACVVARLVSNSKCRHIHAHFGTNSTDVAMLAAQLSGGTYSFTAHGTDETDRPVGLVIEEKIRRASFVAAISSYCRAQLLRWVEPRHWDKVNVIRCGLDLRCIVSNPVQASDHLQFVCVGRFSPEKGHLVLINAFASLVNEGLNCRLVLVGDGELRPLIESRVQELGISDFVSITGWVSSGHVYEEIGNAQVLVLASFAEGLPVVLMEALAMERPVIATAVAGVPELVDEKSGWLVPAGDTVKLADAMKCAVHARVETLRLLGSCGRSRVQELHSSDTEAIKLVDLFLDACAGASS